MTNEHTAPTPLAGARKPNKMNPAAPASLESGLVGVTMEPLSDAEGAIPEGWAFSTADFSVRTKDGSNYGGRVMLVRIGESRERWFRLSEAEREIIPLYVSGQGQSLTEAIRAAIEEAKSARALPGEPT